MAILLKPQKQTVHLNTFQHLEPKVFPPQNLPVVWGVSVAYTRIQPEQMSHKSFFRVFHHDKAHPVKTRKLFLQPPLSRGNCFDDVFWGFSLRSLKKSNEEQLSLKTIFVYSKIFLPFFGIEKKHKSKKKNHLQKKKLTGRMRENPSTPGLGYPSGLSAASESRASSFEEDGSWEFAANCGRHGLVDAPGGFGRRFQTSPKISWDFSDEKNWVVGKHHINKIPTKC